MRKFNRCLLLLLFSYVIFISNAFTNPLVKYRAWQFHKLDSEYVSGAMKLALLYGINTVIFSHGMIGTTSYLYDEPDRGQELQKLAEGHQVTGQKQRVQRAISGLLREAEVSAKNPLIGELLPAAANEIRKVAKELQEMLEKL